MSIESVTEMWSRRTGGIETDGKIGNRSYASAYQVVHSPGATVNQILGAAGIPQPGSLYPGSSYIFCRKVGDIQPVGPIMSVVPVTWSGQVDSTGADNPLDRPPVIQWSNARTSEPVDTDAAGYPLTNSVGETVDGLTKDINDFILTIDRNYAAINIPLTAAYLDSVNSDLFAGWLPGTAAMDSFTATSERDDIQGYWRVQARIIFRVAYNTDPSRAWWHRYRNEGYYERIGVGVTFAGGGGTGAAGYAITSGSGAVTKIVLTSRGRGYTSAPTVTITGGSGAAATATIKTVDDGGFIRVGQVQSVSVGSGGSGYKARLVRCVDDNKEPVTRPVLLAANGSRLNDTDSAVWIERPAKQYYLPYNALGLL